MNIVDRDSRSVRAQGGDRGVAQPDGFFDQRAGAIILAEQVAGFVVGVEDCAVDASGDFNPLADGVVEAKAELISGAQASRGVLESLLFVCFHFVQCRLDSLEALAPEHRPLRRRCCAQ